MPTKMDIVAITETSEKDQTGFLNNVEIEGHDIYHTSSKTSKGGTAIYVNKKYDTLNVVILILIMLNLKLYG